MAMDRQEFFDLCPAYALGLLDGDDLSRFRASLAAADGEMLAAYRQAANAAANLSLVAPEAELSPKVLDRLMTRIESGPRLPMAPANPAVSAHSPAASVELRQQLRSEPPNSPKPRIAWSMSFSIASGVAVALALVVLGLVGYVASLREGLGKAGAVAAQGRARIEALEDSLAQKEAMLAVIRSSQMQMVVMKGLEADPVGYGKIIWDPVAKRAILHVSNLPPQAADKDYQLWVIRDQKPVDAGVFQVKGSRKDGELFKIDQLVETDRSRISAFAITLEPKGGLPQPSGKMYLLGSI